MVANQESLDKNLKFDQVITQRVESLVTSQADSTPRRGRGVLNNWLSSLNGNTNYSRVRRGKRQSKSMNLQSVQNYKKRMKECFYLFIEWLHTSPRGICLSSNKQI
jgi:hypothetical protein